MTESLRLRVHQHLRNFNLFSDAFELLLRDSSDSD